MLRCHIHPGEITFYLPGTDSQRRWFDYKDEKLEGTTIYAVYLSFHLQNTNDNKKSNVNKNNNNSNNNSKRTPENISR